MTNIKTHQSNPPVLFQKGQLPLVISAPHAGLNKPTSIPDRKRDGSLLLADTFTKEIALGMSKLIEEYYNRKPYLIINNISRRKADVNRSIEEGTESKEGRAIWKEYHQSLHESIDTVLKHHKHGLLIDIHGHTHSHGMIELGYLLEADELKRNPDELNRLILEKSSIQTLVKRIPVEPIELLKKEISLGALISKQHLKVVPSPEQVEPDQLFVGGYITQNYHSNRHQKGLDAIQVELPKKLRFDPKSRDYLIKVLADTVIQFLNAYYIPNSKL